MLLFFTDDKPSKLLDCIDNANKLRQGVQLKAIPCYSYNIVWNN